MQYSPEALISVVCRSVIIMKELQLQPTGLFSEAYSQENVISFSWLLSLNRCEINLFGDILGVITQVVWAGREFPVHQQELSRQPHLSPPPPIQRHANPYLWCYICTK